MFILKLLSLRRLNWLNWPEVTFLQMLLWLASLTVRPAYLGQGACALAYLLVTVGVRDA